MCLFLMLVMIGTQMTNFTISGNVPSEGEWMCTPHFDLADDVGLIGPANRIDLHGSSASILG
jgi:hypothetical protein